MSATDSSTPPPASSSAPIRVLIMIGLLGVMLGALWYDRKVARPAVEDAYARIAKLNSDINSKAGHQFMTNQDVQNELKRNPIEILRQDGYLIEVYGWRAGLPTRTHNYYAVYSDEPTPIFLKHYMNYLDKDELKTLPTIVPASGNLTDVLTGELHPSAPGKGPSGQRKQSKKQEPSDDKPVLKSDDKKETASKEGAKKDEDKEAGEKNDAEKKAEEKKDTEKKEAEKVEGEKPQDEKKESPPNEKPAAEKST